MNKITPLYPSSTVSQRTPTSRSSADLKTLSAAKALAPPISPRVRSIVDRAHAVPPGAPLGRRLEADLRRLLHNDRPSVAERLLLAKAFPQETPPINHFAFLAQQTQKFELDPTQLEPGQMEELFDIAGLLNDGNVRAAKGRFNQLPQTHKHCVQTLLHSLGAESFEENPSKTMRALIGTANELVGNGEPCPSQAEVADIFAGLKDEIR